MASAATRRSQRTKRGLLELAGAIKCSTGRSALAYMMYGCYCGLGGQGWPRDRADWWGSTFNHTLLKPERRKYDTVNSVFYFQEYHSWTPDDSVCQNVNIQVTLYVWSTYTLCNAKDIIQHAMVMFRPPLLTCRVHIMTSSSYMYTRSFRFWMSRLNHKYWAMGWKEGMVSKFSRLTWSSGCFKIGPKIPHPNPNCRLLLFLFHHKTSNPLKPGNC